MRDTILASNCDRVAPSDLGRDYQTGGDNVKWAYRLRDSSNLPGAGVQVDDRKTSL